MKHMQRISTWTVFKGEPVFFQAGSEGCSSSRTPGADVPSSLNAMPRPSPRTPGVGSAAPARGRPGWPPRAGCSAEGHGCLVPCLWFLGFPLQGEDSPLFPVRKCTTACCIQREEDGKNCSCQLSNGIFLDPCPSVKAS